VYFRVAHFPEYGSLSGAQLDDMVAQEPSDLKEDPRDFALWKTTKEGEDTSWDSPWGRGRPGWHIECSAMAEKHLGPEFEVHGGGLDLRFPHHENELAQSRGAGRPFARLWAHNGLLELAQEKMSKSVGNIVSLREVLTKYQREAILLFFLGGHYRQPIQYSDAAMVDAQIEWGKFLGAFHVPLSKAPIGEWRRLSAVLDDDFNTPRARAVLHEWRERGYWNLLKLGLSVFGLALPPMARTGPSADELRQQIRSRVLQLDDVGADISDELEDFVFVGEPPFDVRELAYERHRVRMGGEFDRADQLRQEILHRGWDVQDTPRGFRLLPRP
jgi:cysteinyl-tRNA synthetase